MSNPMLEPRRRAVGAAVVVFVALALSVGKPARGEVSVSEEQAEASAVATEAIDAVRYDEASANWNAVDAKVATIDWSEPGESLVWFPTTAALDNHNTASADADNRANLLSLAPSPMRTPGLTSQFVAPPAEIIPNEHAVIPLPPAAWTGLAGLASLATIGGRKALVRFFFT